MLAAHRTDDDVLEYKGLSEGRKRFGDQGQVHEVELIVSEEREDMEP
jgi:hypothetical protein